MGFAELSNEDVKQIEQWTSVILNGDKRIISIIEDLRNELSNKELLEVGLTKVIKLMKSLPEDNLDVNEVIALLEFFLCHLEASALRSGCVVEGVHYLITRCKNLPPNIEILVFQGIYKENTVQCFDQHDRTLLFELLEWLLKYQLAGLKPLQYSFLLSFMKAVNGERDPRCLLQVFGLYLIVVNNFDLGIYCEDFFELLAVYYPIEYVPADDTQVSRALLVSGLEPCLLCHKSFAFFCYQLIADKLLDESVDDNLRVEIFEFLSKAVGVFSVEPMRTFLDDYLTVFRRVCLDPSNKVSNEIPNGAKVAITAVVKAFSHDKETIKMISNTMVENCEPFVLQAEMGLTTKALNLLSIVCQADKTAAEFVLPHIAYWLSALINADTVNAPQNRKEIMIEAVEFLPLWLHLSLKCGFSEIAASSLSGFVESFRRIEETFGSVVFATEYKFAEMFLAHKANFQSQLPEVEKFIEKLVWRAVTDLKLPKPALRDSIHGFITEIVRANFESFAKLIDAELSKRGPEDSIIMLYALGINDTASLQRFSGIVYEFLSKNFDADVVPTLVEVFERNKANTVVMLEFSTGILNVFLSRALAGEHDGEKAAEFLQAIFLRLEKNAVNKLAVYILKAWNDALNNDHVDLVVAVSTLALMHTNEDHIIDNAISFVENLSNKSQSVFASQQHLRFAHYMLSNQTQSIDPVPDNILAVKASFLRSGSSTTIANIESLFSAFEKAPVSNLNSWRHLPDIIDYSVAAYDPCRNGFPFSVLWRQRILCQFIPIFVRWFNRFENLPEHRAIFLGLLEPLLFSVQLLPIPLTEELCQLFPVLTAALTSLMEGNEKENVSVISLVVSGLVKLLRNAPSKSLPESELKSALYSLQLILKGDNVPLLLQTLDALDLIGKKSAVEHILPSFAATILALMLVSGSRKRIIRQRAAAVRNTWELIFNN